MPWALYLNGTKIKEAEKLPTADQSMPRMQAGYEWHEIVEDETPAHNPIYQSVRVTETKQAGKKLRKTKTIIDRDDWQATALQFVERKLQTYLRWELVAVDVVMRSNGPNMARAQAAVAHASGLIASINTGTKPDLDAGWPV